MSRPHQSGFNPTSLRNYANASGTIACSSSGMGSGKQLWCMGDGSYLVKNTQRGVLNKDSVVYRGKSGKAAIEAYNELP